MANRSRGEKLDPSADGYIRSITLLRDQVRSFETYPFSIPAVRGLNTLLLHPRVTFFIGENGTGKSTLLEAIAIKAGFNAEGGSKNFNFATRRSDSELSQYLRLTRGVVREKDGWFLRAESLYNVATEIERLRVGGYGPRSMHEQSHGESFMALANHRFRGHGLYFLDEPEAALSPSRQLAFLKIISDHVTSGASQFIIATHSPIILAYPLARIYLFTGEGIAPTTYEETEQFKVTSDFLIHREAYLHHLLSK